MSPKITRTGNMGTFSVSLPEDEQKILDREAEKNERSRAAQVRVILKDWFKKSGVSNTKSKSEVLREKPQ